MTEKPREIWRKGVPLSEAWFELSEFAIHPSFQYKRKYSALGKKPKSGVYKKQPGSIPEDYEPKDLELRHRKRIKLIAGLKNKLLELLESEELLAFGFMIEPEIKSEPQQIPGGLFIQTRKTPDAIAWDENLFNGRGATFEKVRVVIPSEIEAHTSRPRGRPSKAAILQEAVKIAAARDPGFANLTTKAARGHVVAILKNVLKTPVAQAEAFSDETLRRAIKRVLEGPKTQKARSD